MFLTFIQLVDKRPLRCDVPSDLIILVSTSFLSVSPQSGVALSSFKYPLKEALMERGGRGGGGVKISTLSESGLLHDHHFELPT